MKKSKKNKILVCAVAVFLLGFSQLSWLHPANEYSDSERRYLKQFPELSMQTLLNGTFMSNFESYTLDQFPMRDIFRGIKSAAAGYVFRQEDNNHLYLEDGYIVSMEYPANADSLEWAADRFRNVYDRYLKDSRTQVYVSIIPDKNYFLAEESGHLSMDYDSFILEMAGKVPFMEYIDITGSLSVTDYYKTDIHWKQTGLLDVADVLAEGMGITLQETYETVTLEDPFYGVYYGQLALPVEPDRLSYLSNERLEQCRIYDYQNEHEIPMYDMTKAAGKDPYEMFLGGPLSLLTIENPNAAEDRELVIFRDSFGSCLAPLLTEAYAKITLVDIRYMQSALLEKYIAFDDQDVLFLYSTSVLNHSETIK